MAPGDLSSMTREASLEAMSYLRRQHDAEVLRLRQYAELKDTSIRELTDRLREAEQEITALRNKSQRGEETLFSHMEEVASELEDARKMLKFQEQRSQEEETLLRQIAERTRQQMAAETARFRELEGQWSEREQQYLLDARELQARSEKAMEEAAAHEGRARQAVNDLREAKHAIEQTLGELLKERRDREALDKERAKALSRVSEVENHMGQLQKLWDEERKQWQELWDRERSTWETQKREYANWEGKLRQERQDWHKQLTGLKEREAKFHETMAESLRKSSQVGEKITSMLQFAAAKAVDVISARPGQAPSGGIGQVGAAGQGIRPPRSLNLRFVGSIALAFCLLVAAFPVWRHMHRLRFELAESHVLIADSPTGMAYDGNVLWLSQWNGAMVSLDPTAPSEALFKQAVTKAGIYHPNSIAIWGDALYSLDTAQSRVMRHSLSQPSKIEAEWPSPGPAPIALAHDGRNLWSYDAASRAVYRHLGEGKEAHNEAYKVDLDILPSAMTWYKEELWMYDIKNLQMAIFKIKGKSLELIEAKPFATPLHAMFMTYRADKEGKQQLELWGLYAPSDGDEPSSIKKFRIKR
jgi:hypothetical protein